MNAHRVTRLAWMLVVLAGCAPDAAEDAASDEPGQAEALAQVASPWSRSTAGSAAQRAAGFTAIGGEAESSPAIAHRGAGRVDVFVRAADDTIRHRTYPGANTWSNLGGNVQGDPAAVSWGEGRVAVFARGSDNALWQKTWQDDEWSPWRSLGGTLGSGPAAASGSPGEIDVIARSSASGLVHRQFRDGAWGDWMRLDGTITSDPALDVDDNGYIHLAARAPNGTMIYRRYETGWSRWQEVPGGASAQSGPAVAYGDGKVVGFVRGGDSAIWTISYVSGRWSLPRRLGGNITHSPEAVHSIGRIDLAVVGPDKVVYLRSFADGPSGPAPADDVASTGVRGPSGSAGAPGL